MRLAVLVAVALAGAACASLGACESTSLEGLSGGDDATDAGALVRCPVERCTPDAPLCCAEGPDGSVYLASTCREAGACGAGGVVVRCRGSADCTASNVCCVFRRGLLTRSIECVAPSSCTGDDTSVLCDRQTPACADGEICSDDKSVSAYARFDICHRPN